MTDLAAELWAQRNKPKDLAADLWASRGNTAPFGTLYPEDMARNTIHLTDGGEETENPDGSRSMPRFTTPSPLSVVGDMAKDVGQFGIGVVNSIPQGVGSLMQAQALGVKQAGGALAKAFGADPSEVDYRLATTPDPMLRAGQAVSETQIPSIPGKEGGMADVLGHGVGFVGQAALPGGILGKGAALALGGLEGAALQGVANYHQTLAATGDHDKAFQGLIAGGAIGAAGVVPLNRVMARIQKASGGRLGDLMADAVVFGGTGGVQTALNDLVLEHTTDEDLPIWKDALESAGMGALTGLLVGVGTNVLMSRAPKQITDKGPEVDLDPRLDFARGDDTPPDAGLDLFRDTTPDAAPAPGQKEIPVSGESSPESVPSTDGGLPFARGDDAAVDPVLGMFRAKGEAAVEPAPQPKPVTVEPVNAEAKQIPAASEPVAEPVAPKVEQPPAAESPKPAPKPEQPAVAEMPKGAKLGTDLTGEPVYSKVERGDYKPERAKEQRVTQIGAFDEQGGLFERQAEARDSGAKTPASETQQAKPKRIDPLKVRTVREMLQAMADSEVGQAQEGGKIILDDNRQFAGRTKHISEAEIVSGSSWWKTRPGNMSAEAVRNTVKKALAGKPLGKAQQAMIDHMVAEIESRHSADVHEIASHDKFAAKDAKEREAIQNEGKLKNKVVEVAPGVSFATAKDPWTSFISGALDLFTAKTAHGGAGGGKQPKGLLPDSEGLYVPREETRIENALRRVADRFHTLRRVEKEAPAHGEFSDAEVRMHGRAALKQRQLERDQNAAIEIMRKAGLTAQDMADYATARHAATRDAIIRERSKGENENGSGMDPKRAAEILKKATPEQKRAMEIHDRVRERTRKFMVESGLISQETADAWQATFGDTYTPLKTIDEPGSEFIRGSGKSLQIRGPESKRAEGRTTEADNPFVQMFQDAQEAIARGEKNITSQKFGILAKDNPSTYWDAPTTERIVGDDVFTYKVDGVEHYIRVHDATTLRALKNLDPVVSNQLFRAAMAGARMMSGFATSLNPEFILPNFTRDLHTAFANISVEQNAMMATRIAKNSFKATVQIGKAIHNPESAQGYAKEYLEHGALTDWLELPTITKRLKGLDRALKEGGPRRGLREVADTLSSISSAVENGTRFAAFKEFRKAGMSPDKAAVLAKELTVNWSKKGEWGPFANSLYLFFSASVNGTLRMGQVIRSNPAKAAKVAAAMAASGYGLAALNRAWGGKDEKDDKEWWDKQNDANKRRYAMIQQQDGETFKIPLAPGWGFFVYLGYKMEEAVHRQKPADIGDVVSALAEQVSPVGGGSIAQVVSPWFLDPFVQASENKDFKGDPIYRERYPGEKQPYSSKEDPRASETSKAISALVNELTGGTKARAGSADIPPRALDYIAREAGSGVGRFMERVGKLAKAKIKGEANPWHEWPILSRFRGDAPNTYSRDFYANLDKIKVEEAARKAGEKYDAAILRQKERAALFEKRIKILRDAGQEERARDLQARFNKGFPK